MVVIVSCLVTDRWPTIDQCLLVCQRMFWMLKWVFISQLRPNFKLNNRILIWKLISIFTVSCLQALSTLCASESRRYLYWRIHKVYLAMEQQPRYFSFSKCWKFVSKRPLWMWQASSDEADLNQINHLNSYDQNDRKHNFTFLSSTTFKRNSMIQILMLRISVREIFT